MRCSKLYLHLIREKSLYIQDISCLGLCHIYELAKSIEKRSYDMTNVTARCGVDVVLKNTLQKKQL